MSQKASNLVFDPQIIIAEDDMDDKKLMQEAFMENHIVDNKLIFVSDGLELIEKLDALPPRPTIILLDLNMPKMDGREALQQIKSSDKYCHIPVLIFTTSKSQDDIRLAYQHGSNSFFTKPAVFEELVKTIGIIKKYWFEKAVLPGDLDAPPAVR